MQTTSGHPFRNKFMWLIGFLVLLVIIVVAVKFTMKDRQQSNGQNNEQMSGDNGPVEVEKKDVAEQTIPSGIPGNLPKEDGAKVLQNYTATTQAGVKASTRQIESKKSVDENARIYTDFFKNNGWKITNESGIQDTKAITATKDKDQLQVTINKNSITSVVTVDVTWTELYMPKN